MIGQVMSLHIHGSKQSGDTMRSVQTLTLVAGKGIKEDSRYYDCKNKTSGFPNKNHISMIERDQILDLMQDIYDIEENEKIDILPGKIRSNVEYTGSGDCFLAKNNCIKIGETAVVQIYKSRTTCYQMDNIYKGLQALTKNNKLGVIGEVLVSGEIKVGDLITSFIQ